MADWVTITAYVVTALLSMHAAECAVGGVRPADRLFWRAMAVLMILLGINELLDLEMLLTPLGRDYAEVHGWYGEHRRFQRIVVIALAVASVLAETIMLWWTRHAHSAVRWALAGLIFIVL